MKIFTVYVIRARNLYRSSAIENTDYLTEAAVYLLPIIVIW